MEGSQIQEHTFIQGKARQLYKWFTPVREPAEKYVGTCCSVIIAEANSESVIKQVSAHIFVI